MIEHKQYMNVIGWSHTKLAFLTWIGNSIWPTTQELFFKNRSSCKFKKNLFLETANMIYPN
jgi:hypothetical protein